MSRAGRVRLTYEMANIVKLNALFPGDKVGVDQAIYVTQDA